MAETRLNIKHEGNAGQTTVPTLLQEKYQFSYVT